MIQPYSAEIFQPFFWAENFTAGGTLLGRAKRTLRRPVHLVGRLDRSVSGLSLLAFDPETAEARGWCCGWCLG